MAEPFWYIHLSYRHQQEGQKPCTIDFTWQRGRLFDEQVAQVLYDACCEQPAATVMEVWGGWNAGVGKGGQRYVCVCVGGGHTETNQQMPSLRRHPRKLASARKGY